MTVDPEAPRTFTVADDEHDLRLDHFLAARCSDLSRSQIQKGVADETTLVNDRVRPSRYRVSAGQTVVFTPPVPQPTEALPEDIPLNVLHRDEHVLVLDKAAGMVVHPAPGHYTGTLVNALLHHFTGLPGGDRLRPGIVHRLDKDTTGVMVVALTETAHRDLSEQLRDRTLGRTYQALAWGQWREDSGLLTGQVSRHPSQRQRMAVVPSGGRSAVTHYEVAEDFGFCQLSHVKLETGRTHQIRVQFAAGGHPVVGDPQYGDDGRVKQVHPLDRTAALAMVKGASRQMLHAWRLELRHPATGETMHFESAPPADMVAVLDVLRAHCPE